MYKPDKWELKYFKDEDKIEIIVREDDGRITNGFAAIPCYGEDDVDYEDQWETARLLVSAPKLLAACKRLLTEALGSNECQVANGITHTTESCSVCNAKAAIKAAKKG